MTCIRVNKNKHAWLIKLDGHAGSGAAGHDLVCACLSLLTTMIAQILSDNAEIVVYKSFMGDGAAEFGFNTEKTSSAEEQITAITKGFELLNAAYPAYVYLTSNL